jgi:hypothetical protein
MDDKEPLPIERNLLARLGVSAISHLVIGTFLTLMTIGARFRFLAIALSLAALVIGISALSSRDSEDKKPGLFIVTAGVLGLILQFGLPFMRPIAATILGFTGLALLASGVWKGIRFLLGLRGMGN